MSIFPTVGWAPRLVTTKAFRPTREWPKVCQRPFLLALRYILTGYIVQDGQLSVHGLESDVLSTKVVQAQVTQSAITSSISAFESNPSERRQLSPTACKHIETYVLQPLLKEESLKPFHPLVRSISTRIVNKEIVFLRDLEKTLLWLAPVSFLFPV